MDRSIVVEMTPATPDMEWGTGTEAEERGERLRQRCKALIEARTDDIDDTILNFPGLPFLRGREVEIWTPIFLMCDLFAPHRRRELEVAAADLCAAKRAPVRRVPVAEAMLSAYARRDGERLLHDLLSVCGDERGVRTGEALTRLKAIHDAPWRNYGGAKTGLTDMQLSQLLRPFGVGPGQFKKAGINRRGYKRSDLEAAIEKAATRYLSRAAEG
jgi:hypothetical protein